VLKTLRKALDEDKTKSYVVEVSPLGLVEMTRQNVTEGVREILTKRCPTCDGEGVVRSEETVAIDVLRKLRELAESEPKADAFLIRVNPKVAAKLVEEGSGLDKLEEESGKHFHFDGGEALPLSAYDVAGMGTREEIEERALPFKAGEEVMLTIEEPHMYDADAAVARVDSYIVSVAGAAPYVGERHLVRIESVARSAANATLIDAEPKQSSEELGEQLESPAPDGRGRGRRGGRRRSGAAASQAANTAEDSE
jgi:ribonuclease G